MRSADRGAATRVVFLHSGYSVDVELATYFALAFRRLGYELVAFGLSDPEMPARFAALVDSGFAGVYCFFSLNYNGLQFRLGGRPVHEATGIPLAFFLADHPLYFLASQGPDVAATIAYVPGRDLVDFIATYYPAGTLAVNSQSFAPPASAPREPALDDFLARDERILAPMNLSIWGRNMDGVWDRIKALPAARSAFVARLIDATLTDCVTPIHTIFETLPAGPGEEERVIADARLALDFVKIWRRDRMVRALIDLPILVSSEYVPADLQVRYPEKFTLLSIAETLPLYRSFRFVLNSFPLMTYAFHERAIKALYGGAVLITDPNNRLREALTDEVDVLFFDYAAAEAARIGAFVADPVRAYQLTVAAHERVRTHPVFHYDSLVDLCAAIDGRRAAAGLS